MVAVLENNSSEAWSDYDENENAEFQNVIKVFIASQSLYY